MDALKCVFGEWNCFNLRFPFLKKPKENSNSLNKYEYYVYKFQSIVIWEHPTQTISSLLFIQLLFWMVVNLCWKFYGIIFTLLLIFCTHNVWTEKIWPEIRLPQSDICAHQPTTQHPRYNMLSAHMSRKKILPPSQIEEYFNNFLFQMKMTLIRFKSLRSSHPMMFCSLLSFTFGILTIIGYTISGIWLLYMIVMASFLSPGVYIHVLSQSLKDSLKQYLNEFMVFLSADGTADENDFVPKLSEEKVNEAYASLFQLNDAGDDFLLVDTDDVNMVALPLFDESTMDDIGKFVDLKVNLQFSESSSVSSDLSENIKFQGSHFNNLYDEFDTSEDDERAFLPDPQYRGEAADVSVLANHVSNFPNINQLSRNLLNIIPLSVSSGEQSRSHTQKAKPCNTDDEFEFVNENDVN